VGEFPLGWKHLKSGESYHPSSGIKVGDMKHRQTEPKIFIAAITFPLTDHGRLEVPE
jgi:hypothetical protein